MVIPECVKVWFSPGILSPHYKDSDVFNGFKKGTRRKKWVKLSMSLFFPCHFPLSVMWVWDEIGSATTAFFWLVSSL